MFLIPITPVLEIRGNTIIQTRYQQNGVLFEIEGETVNNLKSYLNKRISTLMSTSASSFSQYYSLIGQIKELQGALIFLEEQTQITKS